MKAFRRPDFKLSLLSVPFNFQEEGRINRACSISTRVFKITDPNVGGHFYCVHMIQCLERTKTGSLISDCVNGPLKI